MIYFMDITNAHDLLSLRSLKPFKLENLKLENFDFAEIKQDTDFNITITAKVNIEKIKPISYGTKKLISKCNEGEKTQLRSVVQSLAWIARQVRPDLS